MSRRRAAVKREVMPDPVYNDVVLTKFINSVMQDGKRAVAEKAVYGALDMVAAKQKTQPIELFKQAIENVKPALEVRSRRVGGATYQVPMNVPGWRQLALAIRWMVSASRSRSEKTMRERLYAEFVDAANNRGAAVKKREDTHKMADANKAFAHFRW